MKKYRALVPVILIALMAVSIYSMISDAVGHQNEIERLLHEASACAEQGLYDKAASYYYDVIEMDNNKDYYVQIIDMYYNAEQYEASNKWCEKLMEAFPDETVSYEKMIRLCLKLEAYSNAYTVLEDFDGRKLSSEEIEEYRRQMKFLYYEDSLSYDSVAQYSSEYVGVENKDLWGLANLKGSNRIAPKYDQIGYFANGVVPVLDSKGTWYFMNEEGELSYNISDSIEGKVTDAGLYNNDLFPVCVDGKYGYYDIEFKKRFGDYDYAGAFSGGIAAVKEDNKWKLINSNGEVVSHEEYNDIILDERGVCCQKDRIFVKKADNEYIMVDSNGNQIGTDTYEGACLFAGDEYAAVMKNNLWGFINLNGEIMIEPKYKEAKSFSMGLAAVCKDESWGYIDTEENVIIDYQYLECFNFSPMGTAFVKSKNEWDVIKLYQYNH